MVQSSVENSPEIKPADSSPWSRPFPNLDGAPPSAAVMATQAVVRELPDVTGFLVVVLVTLGLFVVPVGATLMQGPAIVASLFSH
ncbi:MAG: hypothetical protein RL685_4288 [Pseudomonadota bacterium]